MKKPLPLWVAAAVPSALVGHALTYALSGRTLVDGHHAWITPAFECSLAFLLAICTALMGGTLIRAHFLTAGAIERSMFELWPRLACAQLLLFALMEQLEGTSARASGCFVQILVALCAAYLLSLFARLLAHCFKSANEASRYLNRLFAEVSSFAKLEPASCAATLAVRVGTHRFQRPPPHA